MVGTTVAAMVTALSIVWFGRKQTAISERLYLSIVLVVIALIYVGFGLYDGKAKHLREEMVGLAIYGSFARLGQTGSIWWLIIGIGAHALWDWAHRPDLLEGYVPGWYREFCMIVDLLVAGYIAIEQPT